MSACYACGMTQGHATLIAGLPTTNLTLYREIRFKVGDPTALMLLPQACGGVERLLLIRDIEMDRARKHARVHRVACAAEFEPASGLSGDRETATAQAVAECLRRASIQVVHTDRTLPTIYAHFIQLAGMRVECDVEWGILARRAKDEQELAWLREAQAATERAMQLASRTILQARAAKDGTLQLDGATLTSDSLRTMIDVFLLGEGYDNPNSIVACGPQGADCHDHGSGDLRTEQPIIVDIFPRNKKTLYNGDMTRTFVHGAIDPLIARMHAAVVAAKRAAIDAVKPGVTGEAVHAATLASLAGSGFSSGQPTSSRVPVMSHGTGHGIGLEVHEPPLLAAKAPALIVGDVLTVEPGLYALDVGGVRVEDMVAVTTTGCENFNRMDEGLHAD